MKISHFIQQEVILPRLKQNGVLIVYDPDVRYRELCLALQSATLTVIDTSEGSILGRSAALQVFNEFGKPNPSLEGMLVYAPFLRFSILMVRPVMQSLKNTLLMPLKRDGASRNR